MDDIFTILKARLGSAKQNRTVLEIGAADGAESAKIALSVIYPGQSCEYFAFEPDHRNAIAIRASALAGQAWYRIVDAAVGNFNGFVPFFESNGEHPFSSSVKIPKLHLRVHSSISFENSYSVRMIRLDDFFSVFRISDSIDFIWCDIQGAEDLMIEGAQQTLANTRLFYSECYEQEMYEGQIGRHEILKRLPGEWNIANEWPDDVLFENLSIK